jgi:hypothetical protein
MPTKMMRPMTVLLQSWNKANIQDVAKCQTHLSKQKKQIYIYLALSWTTNVARPVLPGTSEWREEKPISQKNNTMAYMMPCLRNK